MTVIDHRTQASPGGLSNLKLVYSYDRRNLPTQILESSETGLVAPTTTMYSYDARGRLIAESRSTPDTNGIAYDLEYDYDAGGNRTEKRDFINNRKVVYTYDYQGPSIYGSANNRLAFYWAYDMSGTFISTTYYFYNGIGNPTNVVTEIDRPVGVPKFSATRFIYGANGQTVTYMLGETWDGPNFQGPCYGAYNITFAREFRYDGARQRYLVRELDPDEVFYNNNVVVLSETWTDYDGNNAYGDFTVTGGGPAIQAKQYAPGIGTIDDPTGSPVTKYLHNDHLGTLRTTSTATGSAEPLRVFTAFGEPVTNSPQGNADRYGYVGALGYQAPTSDTANDPYAQSPYLHVGARYYDPAAGRFLQRDPIGISGGMNVYAYVRSMVTSRIDPSGRFSLGFIGAIIGGVIGGVTGYVTGGVSGAIGGAIGGAVTGGLIGTFGPSIAPKAGAIGGAIGGTITGALNGYSRGSGAGGIALRGMIGGATGSAGGYIGGGIDGGRFTEAVVGTCVGLGGSGIETYFIDIPSSIYNAAQRMRRR